MEIFILVWVGFIAFVIYAVVSADKKKQAQKKQQERQMNAVKKLSQDPFAEPKKTQTTKTNSKPQRVTQSVARPSLRDHLHGTTTITKKENCEKDHTIYNEQKYFVSQDESNAIALDDEELEKIIILGEAINNPAFKRGRR